MPNLVADGDSLQVAQVVPVTEAEGPGRRFAIWLQGCPFRCPGCCNPEMLPFQGGRTRTVTELLQELDNAVARDQVEGITLLGGEPLAQAAGASRLAEGTRRRGLSVMVFTGYDWDELRASSDPAVGWLIQYTDLLVDGRYLRDHPDERRRWIGSTNQRVLALTDRYSLDDPFWRKRDTLEIRYADGELVVNGFPAGAAAGFWRKGFGT